MRLPLILLFVAPSIGFAQPGPGNAAFSEVRWAGETEVKLTTRFRGSQGTIELSTERDRKRVHRGQDQGMAGFAGNEAGVLVGALRGDGVRVHFVPVNDRRFGRPTSHTIRRLTGNDRTPIAVIVTPRPDGFAVFWQEAHATNPAEAYRTFVARFARDGSPQGTATEVPAPWPLADAAWLPSQNRYYFLLFYGTGDPRGTRLCGVHIDGTTYRPVQHPWWASAPGVITEGRLAVNGGRVAAVYRGGSEGDRLLEVDVTNGSWGRWAGEARDHGEISDRTGFGARFRGTQIQVSRAD